MANTDFAKFAEQSSLFLCSVFVLFLLLLLYFFNFLFILCVSLSFPA